jgi:hypothetical protein
MAKRKQDPLLEALKNGRSHTWTVPEGGNLASMRKAIKHGQTLTMSPVTDANEIRVGDLVLVKWHQSDIFHIVGEIQGDQFLIVNSLGKVNGWVGSKEILGRITKIIEPEPRPDVLIMLGLLKDACLDLIEQEQPALEDAQRLLSIVDDLQWYANRIDAKRWDTMPRDNIWSFQQNLWRLTRQAGNAGAQEQSRIYYFIDLGKRCVGLASEILSIFENDAAEQKKKILKGVD